MRTVLILAPNTSPHQLINSLTMPSNPQPQHGTTWSPITGECIQNTSESWKGAVLPTTHFPSLANLLECTARVLPCIHTPPCLPHLLLLCELLLGHECHQLLPVELLVELSCCLGGVATLLNKLSKDLTGEGVGGWVGGEVVVVGGRL